RSGDAGAAPGLATAGPKGRAAIEAFLLARLFMFQQVYFHKSTRAAEWMIGAIFRRAIALVQGGARLPSLPEAFVAVAAGDTPTLGGYLGLRRPGAACALHAWEGVADPILSDLSRRLRARSLFKTIELFPERGEPKGTGEEALLIAKDIARAAGLDPEVYVGLDVATDTPYAEDASLHVVFPR